MRREVRDMPRKLMKIIQCTELCKTVEIAQLPRKWVRKHSIAEKRIGLYPLNRFDIRVMRQRLAGLGNGSKRTHGPRTPAYGIRKPRYFRRL